MQKRLTVLLLFLLLQLRIEAEAFGFHLQPADVVLIQLHCYSCQVIANDGGEGFSHSGIVLSDPQNENVMIGQSISTTEAVSLSAFLAQGKKGGMVAVFRAKELNALNSSESAKLSFILNKVFRENYLGTRFDPEFLWNNVDHNGRELLYCSEMITKLLNTILRRPLIPEPMHFSERYFDFWTKYFKDRIPEGHPGTSPGSFVRSELFENVANFQLP